MTNMGLQTMKALCRKNKAIEIITYLIQNNFLHRFLNSSGSGDFKTDPKSLYERGLELAQLYVKNAPEGLSGRVVLEIGTGLTTTQAELLFQLGSAEKVYTWDYFNCIHENNAAALKLCQRENGFGSAHYIAGPLCNLHNILGFGTVDYIVSNATLEHVKNTRELLKTLSLLLKPTGCMFHRVDLRCHNRFRTFGELYFHVFPNWFWGFMGENIGHPNRLLVCDYTRIFEENGLTAEFKNVVFFSDEILRAAKSYLPFDPALARTALFDVLLVKK